MLAHEFVISREGGKGHKLRGTAGTDGAVSGELGVGGATSSLVSARRSKGVGGRIGCCWGLGTVPSYLIVAFACGGTGGKAQSLNQRVLAVFAFYSQHGTGQLALALIGLDIAK